MMQSFIILISNDLLEKDPLQNAGIFLRILLDTLHFVPVLVYLLHAMYYILQFACTTQ